MIKKVDLMNLVIRKATLDDFLVIHDFEVELSEFERSLGVNDVKEKGKVQCYSDDQLKEFLTDVNTCFLIAEVDGAPVGCGFCQIRQNNPTWDKFEKHAYLGLIYVREEFRERGIASKISNKLIRWTKGQGVKEIRLKAYTLNKNALKVYEKQGFVNLVIEMIKQV